MTSEQTILGQAILDRAGGGADPAPIFILGSPRTGSTILYQCMVSAFRLPYFANLTNQHFPAQPILGLSMQAAWSANEPISGKSQYGKVDGLFQPSEASGVMQNWFGGGHPSEITSPAALPERETEMVQTFIAAERLFGRPLVVKNAWHCFRVPYLARRFPRATFVWIRRDIRHAAASDLAARCKVQGDAHLWNSATPRNLADLQKLPPVAQVVENQYEFARAIREAAAAIPSRQFAEVWYEDLCRSPEDCLADLRERLKILQDYVVQGLPPVCHEASHQLPAKERQGINDHVARHAGRLAECCYKGQV